MATDAEKQALYDALKFTPRTYTVSLWGYGGEIVMGKVDKKIYDYFKHRRLDVSDFAWSYEYADENNIPEEMWPFDPGSWYDCSDYAHSSGVDLESGTLQITDENGETVIQRVLDSIDGTDIQLCNGEEAWIGMANPGDVVFVGRSSEKGTFFEGEIELTKPFDPELLEIHYDDIDGESLVSSLYYDGEEISNNDYSTNGKSSDFGFYLVKEDRSWEEYKNMDDIKYEMTEWIPARVKPVHTGVYNVEQRDKNLYIYTAIWNGDTWVHPWNLEQEVKVTKWQGLSQDPDAVQTTGEEVK